MYSGGYAYGVWMTGGPVVSPVGLAERPRESTFALCLPLKKTNLLQAKKTVESDGRVLLRVESRTSCR